MTDLLARKLSSFVDLSDEDRKALNRLCEKQSVVQARKDLIREGDRPEEVYLLLEGWAFRYKQQADGARQILAYLIPGDLADIHVFILKAMDHSIGLLTEATVARIPKQLMLDVMTEHPRIGKAFWWATLVDEAVLRQWLVNLGRRGAFERLAHLFCEMWVRMRSVGLVTDGEFSLPVTQAELGETTGLTSVHVNRTLQRLRNEGLISFDRGWMTIHDSARLAKLSGFNPNYLHLDRRAPGPAA